MLLNTGPHFLRHYAKEEADQRQASHVLLEGGHRQPWHRRVSLFQLSYFFIDFFVCGAHNVTVVSADHLALQVKLVGDLGHLRLQIVNGFHATSHFLLLLARLQGPEDAQLSLIDNENDRVGIDHVKGAEEKDPHYLNHLEGAKVRVEVAHQSCDSLVGLGAF